MFFIILFLKNKRDYLELKLHLQYVAINRRYETIKLQETDISNTGSYVFNMAYRYIRSKNLIYIF